MEKYHIKKDGTPGVCHAKGSCPLGGPESHFDTASQAATVAQERLENEYGIVGKGGEMSHRSEPVSEALFEAKAAELKDKSLSVEESDKRRTELASIRRELDENSDSQHSPIETQLEGVALPDGGATFNLEGIRPTSGFCASPYPEHSKVFDRAEDVTFGALTEYVKGVNEKNPNIFSEDETYLGLWNDPETNKVYLDISKRYSTAEEARTACKNHDQIAFFDLQTFESVDVDREAKSGQN